MNFEQDRDILSSFEEMTNCNDLSSFCYTRLTLLNSERLSALLQFLENKYETINHEGLFAYFSIEIDLYTEAELKKLKADYENKRDMIITLILFIQTLKMKEDENAHLRNIIESAGVYKVLDEEQQEELPT